jgi:phosphatidylinositol alpha-1,6-mannosyltransferase
MSAAERYKGHDELLEAWPSVRAAAPGAQLVVVGGGDDQPRLAARARERGLADDVLFCGRVSDATLDALFERVALFAMPSRGEGFGVVYLQAMRAGLACVGATDDAAGDVIDDGRTGLLVAQRDVAGLARAIGTLLGDPALAKSMGRAGRERYEKEFTYERFRDRLASVLAANGVPLGGGR